jgi:hypothetical protein
MKHTTTSVRRSLSRDTISAGRRFDPDKSVKGKWASTIAPNSNTQPFRSARSASE